ncbi:MAG: hypothetical protein QOJ69_1366 [Actinomycetota bacterium]|jgi:hypothetical protein|nr:hypothetical protein [Actinomycetota bacterium]MEA2843695.1 hypothetical protein [Actinomycetota bacterium]
MRRIVAAATIALAVLVWSAAPSPAIVRGGSGAALFGSQEVPPADPDGIGFAIVTFDPDLGRVCYFLAAFNIAPATAAHIHFAPRGTNGPIVVPFNPPTTGTSSGCAPAAVPLVQNLIAHPSDYYVNVHNAEFPGGAIRGQLS